MFKRYPQEFHTNFDSTMCYVEDVYHTQCNHWAELPRTYHMCASAGGTASAKQCFNPKKCGSVQEDSLCKKCQLHDRMSGKDPGTIMSVYQDRKSKKTVVTIPNNSRSNRCKSRETDSRRRPSGFLRWNIGEK